MPEFTERFFIFPPVSMLWSGDFPLPAIDSRVFIMMNNIGRALVKGYYASGEYVGVMTLPISPPGWLCEQWLEEQKNPSSPEWVKEGIGCEFGSEVSLVEPSRTNGLKHVVLTLQYCLETFEATCQCGTCDPCTVRKDDINKSIAMVEELDWSANTARGGHPARFILQRAAAKAEFDDLKAVARFVRDCLPPHLVLHDNATPAEIAAFASRNDWRLTAIA
jgi:hypothetical protein